MKTKNYYTKLSLLALIVFFFFSACKEEETTGSFDLSSSKNYTIAKSTIDLQSKIKDYTKGKTSADEQISVTKIDYSYLGEYTFANVQYTTSKGNESNIIFTNYNLTHDSEVGAKLLPAAGWHVTCTGAECCRVHMTLPADPKEAPSFECTCSSCTMNVVRD